MNVKGQISIGMLIMAFVGVIVGVALFVTVSQTVGETSDTVVATNVSYTVPADGEVVDLAGQELLDTPIVLNNTNESVDSGNYTIDEGVSTVTGLKTVRYTASGSEYEGMPVNISYSYGDDGYIESGGARSVAALIVIMMALGIAVIALSPALRSGVLQMMGK